VLPRQWKVGLPAGNWNPACCNAFAQNTILDYIGNCQWETSAVTACTGAGVTQSYWGFFFENAFQTWVLRSPGGNLNFPNIQAATYTIPDAQFNCLGPNVLTLSANLSICPGMYPKTITIAPNN
jgi:hypothetical protein